MKRSATRRWYQPIAVIFAVTMIAAACGGEVADDGDPTDPTDVSVTDPTDVTSETDGTSSSDSGATSSSDSGSGTTDVASGETYDDPRGGVFADFQAGFDRSHPFTSLDSFCLPHDEAADRVDVEPGISADTIEIHHIRQELENLIDIGFGVDVGDPDEMFRFLLNEINTECGGIRGRQLNMNTSTYNPLDADVEAARLAGCIQATEDDNAAVVVNSTGFQGTATLCIAEEHNTPLITTQGLNQDFMDRGNGRLITFDFSLPDSLRLLVERADAEGLLEGKTIGIVQADTPGQPEAVQTGLVDTLEGLGYEIAVNETIGCAGGTSCSDGTPEAVGSFLDEGVDIIFPTMNILSMPAFISEMVTQGFQTGEVQFFVSNFNSAAGDLVSSKIKAFGGDAAAALYNGAYVVDSAATGNYLVDGANYPRFNELCVETYAKQGGPAYDYFDTSQNTPQGMLGTVCAQVRLLARAIYDAGDNPSRDDITAALGQLGPVDTNNMVPGSLSDGKYAIVDATQTMTWTSPCATPGGAYDENDTCIVPNGDYESAS